MSDMNKDEMAAVTQTQFVGAAAKPTERNIYWPLLSDEEKRQYLVQHNSTPAVKIDEPAI
jgi:hypothetical protein